jgi:hypothetical protein
VLIYVCDNKFVIVANLIIKNWKQDFVGCVNMNLNLSLAVHFFDNPLLTFYANNVAAG